MIKRAVLFAIIFLSTLSALPAFAKDYNIVKVNSDIEVPKDMAASDVVAIGGNITVYGRVTNNVVAVGGSVFLKSRSYVGQQVVVVGGDLIREPNAQIDGKVTQIYMPRFIPSFSNLLKGGWVALWAGISVLSLLGFLGLAILLSALIPEHMGACVNALEQTFVAMLLWGILWMILIVPIAVLLAISIVGIILIPVEILLAALAFMIGYIASAVFIGKNILLAFRKFSPPFVDAILGMLILFLVGLIPVVGAAVKALFLIAGFGAVLTTRFGTIK